MGELRQALQLLRSHITNSQRVTTYQRTELSESGKILHVVSDDVQVLKENNREFVIESGEPVATANTVADRDLGSIAEVLSAADPSVVFAL